MLLPLETRTEKLFGGQTGLDGLGGAEVSGGLRP